MGMACVTTVMMQDYCPLPYSCIAVWPSQQDPG